MTSTSVKRLLAISPLALMLLGTQVYADLGSAETEIAETFDAYCGKRGNDCRVTFEEARMRVDDGKGITRDQLISFKYTGPDLCVFSCPDLPWVLSYKNSEGEIKTARIIFRHGPTNIRFGQALEVFAGPTRKLGPSIKVEIDN